MNDSTNANTVVIANNRVVENLGTEPQSEYADHYRERDDAIAAAYWSGSCTAQHIGDHFDVHYSRVSRIIWALHDVKANGER